MQNAYEEKFKTLLKNTGKYWTNTKVYIDLKKNQTHLT